MNMIITVICSKDTRFIEAKPARLRCSSFSSKLKPVLGLLLTTLS